MHKSPGPGEYKISLKSSGPSFSIYGRLPEKLSARTPGPGTYKLPISKVVCTKFSPIPRQRLLKDFEKLGPGSYDFHAQFEGPKWRFGGGVRRSFEAIESPGPGSYSLPSTTSKTSFSFYPRRSDPPIKPSPGPGSYHPKLIDKSLKFSLKSRLPYILRNETPGPGTYSPALSLDFGRLLSDRFKEKNRVKIKRV